MPFLASLCAFGYYGGCVDCKLSPVACDVLSVSVLSTSVERTFSISRETSRRKNRLVEQGMLKRKNKKYLTYLLVVTSLS